MGKVTHFLYMPMTGLGLYGGHRGKRWLRNRIKIFKHFVLPSLLAQTNQNFILWVSFRYEDRNDYLVKEFQSFLELQPFRTVFTFAGVCFWDDKYPDKIAHERLLNAIHGSMGDLLNVMGEAEEILMTIQPSDDCYHKDMVKDVQSYFASDTKTHVFGYTQGYVMDYLSGRLCEWNPKTTPPFYTIRFTRKVFTDPNEHARYIGPYKSHEYVKDFLPSIYLSFRGFIVGTHGENISTIFNHPFAGSEFSNDTRKAILSGFGLSEIKPICLKTGFRRKIMRLLPYGWQRKLRYWLGERFYARFYDFIRA